MPVFRNRIQGSVLLAVKSSNGRIINIQHLSFESFSHWVNGRNFTLKASVIHAAKNAIAISQNGVNEVITMTGRYSLSYISLSRFKQLEHESVSVLHFLNWIMLKDKPSSNVNSIVDKVHNHASSVIPELDAAVHLPQSNNNEIAILYCNLWSTSLFLLVKVPGRR